MPYNLRVVNIQWMQDRDGWYWVAELWRGDRKIGVTGNYYFREDMPWD
jgi:hypothetical protein